MTPSWQFFFIFSWERDFCLICYYCSLMYLRDLIVGNCGNAPYFALFDSLEEKWWRLCDLKYNFWILVVRFPCSISDDLLPLFLNKLDFGDLVVEVMLNSCMGRLTPSRMLFNVCDRVNSEINQNVASIHSFWGADLNPHWGSLI